MNDESTRTGFDPKGTPWSGLLDSRSLSHITRGDTRPVETTELPLIGAWDHAADQAANAVYYLKQTRVAEGQVEAKETHLVPPILDEDHKFEIKVRALFEEALELLLSKHRAYGPKNIADAPGGALNGIRVRVHDKISRINNLIDNNPENAHESLKDSWIDLANYALIACLVLDKAWPGLDGD